MTDSTVTPIADAAALPLAVPEQTFVPPAVQSAARWFWWIAGLSLVNTVMLHSGSDTSFVMGLGITMMSDAVLGLPLGVIVDAVVLGLFTFLGFQATRGKAWAFYVGIPLYTLDSLIFLGLQDWMPVAFHALAIFFLVNGALALRAWRNNSN